MNKKNNLALFTLFVVGISSLLTSSFFAQKTASLESEYPKPVVVKKDTLQSYIDISLLPVNKRSRSFGNLSAEEKANVFKLHLAFQLIKRPNLTDEQKDIILDGVSMIKPETYIKEDSENFVKAQQEVILLEARAKSAFPGREGFEIFANLSGDSNDIQILQNYQQVTSAKYQVERRASFRKLSSQEKSYTMKIHLALQMANLSLNKQQYEFISEAISIMTPQVYRVKKGTSEWKKVDTSLSLLKDRTLNFFQKENAAEIFASLGGEKGEPENTENLAPNCSCSGQSDYCGWWRNGASCSGGSCRFQVGGCGTGLFYDCDGMCTGGVV